MNKSRLVDQYANVGFDPVNFEDNQVAKLRRFPGWDLVKIADVAVDEKVGLSPVLWRLVIVVLQVDVEHGEVELSAKIPTIHAVVWPSDQSPQSLFKRFRESWSACISHWSSPC